MSTTSQPIEGSKPAVINCTGRRKEAVARVFLRPGSGKFTVNGREIKDYFHNIAWLNAAVEPLKFTNTTDQVDVAGHHKWWRARRTSRRGAHGSFARPFKV